MSEATQSDQGQQQMQAAVPLTERPRDLTATVRGLIATGEKPTDDQSDQGEQRGDEKPAADPSPNAEPDDLSEEGLGMQAPTAPGGDSDDEQAGALQTLAEQAGLSVEDLYAVEIPLGDEREPITLGDLKDKYQDFANLTDQRAEFDETRTTFENDILRARAELQEVISLLPTIPPELIQQAAATHAQNQAKERDALYQIKPEWRDPETFARVQDGIFDVVAEYGFNRAEMDSVHDHRLTKLLYDFQTMRERFAEANAQRKRQVNSGGLGRAKGTRVTASKAAKNQQLNEAAAAPSHSSTKRNAIKNILLNGV